MSSSTPDLLDEDSNDEENIGRAMNTGLSSDPEFKAAQVCTQRNWVIPSNAFLDISVFLPLGALFKTARNLNDFQHETIEHLESRVDTARAVGEFVVNTGWKNLQDRFKVDRLVSTHQSSSEARPNAKDKEGLAPLGSTVTASPGQIPDGGVSNGLRSTTPNPEVLEVLAGYDSLSAAQVIRRLPGISKNGLMAIKLHETSSRNRKSVLNALEQLLGTKSDETSK